ncbi:hypothetical protein GCM10018980_44180 [Streptomyces capoamus]|uniref:Uncharacterized protein n=1 Tax=Streptomyces capoamus TaxID=68183 RepID=A0A919EY31_9ACTN|nr:hypothetical protein GCM10010501_68140 [Streptomyces libani subsp. rufus]GHG57512.1 hypothetical protein GCM10018980_44180 [Streptomyces capoamus]
MWRRQATITALRIWAAEWANDLAPQLLKESHDPDIGADSTSSTMRFRQEHRRNHTACHPTGTGTVRRWQRVPDPTGVGIPTCAPTSSRDPCKLHFSGPAVTRSHLGTPRGGS